MKGSLALLLAPKGKAPMSAADTSDEDGEMAAKDLLSAIKDGDAKAVWEAFKSLDDLCESYEGGEEGPAK